MRRTHREDSTAFGQDGDGGAYLIYMNWGSNAYRAPNTYYRGSFIRSDYQDAGDDVEAMEATRRRLEL